MAILALGMGRVPVGSVLVIALTVVTSVSTRVSNANCSYVTQLTTSILFHR